MEENLPNFDLGLGYLFPAEPEEKKTTATTKERKSHSALPASMFVS